MFHKIYLYIVFFNLKFLWLFLAGHRTDRFDILIRQFDAILCGVHPSKCTLLPILDFTEHLQKFLAKVSLLVQQLISILLAVFCL